MAGAASGIKLGVRRGGNNDVSSLQRELDSLRGYRDVLHDTMKGLVAQSQGKLSQADQPELIAGLSQVATLLAAFSTAPVSLPALPDTNEEMEALRAQVEHERAGRLAAESHLATREADFEQSTIAAQKALASTEKHLASSSRQLAQQRQARERNEAELASLADEAVGLDAALCGLVASEACVVEHATIAHEAALARVREALACAEARADEAVRDSHLATAAAAGASGDAASAALAEARRIASREAAARSDAEAALAAADARFVEVSRDLHVAASEAARWRAEAEANAAEIASLRRRLLELEQQQQQQQVVPAQKASRFAKYVESLDEQRGGGMRPGSGRVDTRAQPPPSAIAAAAAPSTAPSMNTTAGSQLRSARDRGGSLLKGDASERPTAMPRPLLKQPATAR